MASDEQPIGKATMTQDGTIVLDLRAELPEGGGTGIGRLIYPPGHPQYDYILKHVGEMQPGEQKLVMPFPDERGAAEKPPESPAPPGLRCTNCGTVNPPGSRFCNQCGTALGCPSCGTVNPAGSQFCNRCGTKLG